MRPTIALFAATAALAGCASLNSIDADVSSFSRWPAGRVATSYAFERLPSAQAQPQQAQMLEDVARPAVEAAGFVAAPEGSVADVTVLVGARITETDRSPFDDPFWYGGFGTWHRPFAGRFGRPLGGPGWRRGYWGSGYDSPYYMREVAVLIRDKRSAEPLYEARAESEGPTTGLQTALPAMFAAAFRDFPNGAPSNPHRVTIEAPPSR